MSDFPTVIAWSWGAEHYHQKARALRERCEELGYPHSIDVDVDLSYHFSLQPGGDWEQRMWVYRYIPHFIGWEAATHGDVLYLHPSVDAGGA